MYKYLLILALTASAMLAAGCSKTDKADDANDDNAVEAEASNSREKTIEQALKNALNCRENDEERNYAIYDQEADTFEVVNNFIFQLTDSFAELVSSPDDSEDIGWTDVGEAKSAEDLSTIAHRVSTAMPEDASYAIRISYEKGDAFKVACHVIY